MELVSGKVWFLNICLTQDHKRVLTSEICTMNRLADQLLLVIFPVTVMNLHGLVHSHSHESL